MTHLRDSFAKEYDEKGKDGIAWGKEVLSARGRHGAAGRWGTPTDVQNTDAEYHLMMLLIELRKQRKQNQKKTLKKILSP